MCAGVREWEWTPTINLRGGGGMAPAHPPVINGEQGGFVSHRKPVEGVIDSSLWDMVLLFVCFVVGGKYQSILLLCFTVGGKWQSVLLLCFTVGGKWQSVLFLYCAACTLLMVSDNLYLLSVD